MPPFEFLRKLSFDFITAREQPLRTPLETNKVDEPFGRVFQVTFEEAKLVAGSERSSVHLVAQPLAEATSSRVTSNFVTIPSAWTRSLEPSGKPSRQRNRASS